VEIQAEYTTMKQVAKLIIVDHEGKYLLMYRNAHPNFGNDPDLPGGTLEEGELPLGTMIREAQEEAGIDISEHAVKHLYGGTAYSVRQTHYSLFIATLEYRPTVTMSWEHSGYEWLDRDAFLEKAKNAADTYMQMVYDILK